MNRGMLPKLKDQKVRLRPLPWHYNGSGVRLKEEEKDDSWFVSEASEDKIRLRNDRTGHTFDLTPDHIHEYRTDPETSQGGFLTLHSQAFIQGSKVSIEPLVPAGREVSHNPVNQGRIVREQAASEEQSPEGPQALSQYEIEILTEAKDQGVIFVHESDQSGKWVHAGMRHFESANDPAFAAYYLEALQSLQDRGLVKHAGGILYRLTAEGFRIARISSQ